MANVLIRNMPDALYAQLRERATRERRSVPAEVVRLVETALLEEVVHEPVAAYTRTPEQQIGSDEIKRLVEEAQRDRPKEDPRVVLAHMIERSQSSHPERFDSLAALREDRAR